MTTPSAAPVVSRFINAPASGTARLRNTIINSSEATSVTIATNSGSFAVRTSAKSANTAVWPPTRTRIPVPLVAIGITLERSVLSSVEVEGACGEPVG